MSKLYYHKTDGGAEYLCTSPVEGTDEGDLRTTIVRLDGEPELINCVYEAAPDLLKALKAIQARINGEWDNPALLEYGLLGSTYGDITRITTDAIRKVEGEG